MAQMGHPETLDNYNWDLVARRKGELMNVPAMFIVPEQAEWCRAVRCRVSDIECYTLPAPAIAAAAA